MRLLDPDAARKQIVDAVRDAGGQYATAARSLGIPRRTLWNHILADAELGANLRALRKTLTASGTKIQGWGGRLAADERSVVDAVKIGCATRAQIVAKTSLPDGRVTEMLGRCVRDGRLKRTGNRRGATYVLANGR